MHTKRCNVKCECIVMSDVGLRLRLARERTGLNQTDFAELGGVSRNTQTKYETGERAPDSDYFQRLRDQNIDIVYILTGQEQAGDFLSSTESELLSSFRSLSPVQQQALVQMIGSMLDPFYALNGPRSAPIPHEPVIKMPERHRED